MLQYLAVGLGSLSTFAFLNSQGDTATTFRLNTIHFVLKILLGTLLAWKWGVPGLLVAMLASILMGNIVNLHIMKRIYAITLDFTHACKVMGASLISAVVTSVVIRFFPNTSPLHQIIVGGFVFFLSCLILMPLFKAVRLDDLYTFRRITKKMDALHLVSSIFITFMERIIDLRS